MRSNQKLEPNNKEEVLSSLPIQMQEALKKGLSGEINSLSIQFKDSSIHSIEITKEEPVKKRLTDILNEDSYQTVELKKHEGKISYIKKSVKIKLK